jgi:hypothetical protein
LDRSVRDRVPVPVPEHQVAAAAAQDPPLAEDLEAVRLAVRPEDPVPAVVVAEAALEALQALKALVPPRPLVRLISSFLPLCSGAVFNKLAIGECAIQNID